jgi:hypothetical protein
MRRPLAVTAAVLAVATAPLAGCGGGSDKPAGKPQDRPASLAHSAAATRAATSARIAFRGTVNVAGARVPVSGNGTVDFKSSRAHLRAGTRLPGAGALSVEQIIDGRLVYVRAPELLSILPGGKAWLKFNLGQADGGLLDAMRSMTGGGDISQYLAWLAVAGNARRVGTETVGGVPTTHYAARVDVQRIARTADPATRRSLMQLGVRTIPLDVWIDGQSLVRRMHVVLDTDRTPIPAGMDLTADFSAFGTPVDATPPAPGDALDLTSGASSLLSLLGG